MLCANCHLLHTNQIFLWGKHIGRFFQYVYLERSLEHKLWFLICKSTYRFMTNVTIDLGSTMYTSVTTFSYFTSFHWRVPNWCLSNIFVRSLCHLCDPFDTLAWSFAMLHLTTTLSYFTTFCWKLQNWCNCQSSSPIANSSSWIFG